MQQTAQLGPPPGVPGYRLLQLLEPARPRRIATSSSAPMLAVATVCIGAFMGQLDTSIVSVALPRMSHDLHAGVAAVEWVSLTYVLTLVALVVPIGTWADTVGRKSLYIGGFAVFSVGSAACAFAPDLGLLCGFRVVQAVGAALMQANSVALIAAIAPRSRLGRMVGMQAAAQAIGLAAGPALGGLLLAVGGWRLLFLVNVPAGVVGLITGAVLLPRSRDLAPARRIDPIGIALLIPVVGLALLAMSLATRSGQAWSALAAGLAALVLGVVAMRHQRRSAAPLVQRVVIEAPGLRRGLFAALCGYAVLFGALVAVPLFLTRTQHLDTANVGLLVTALPIGIGIVAPVAGRLADRAPGRVARGGLLVAVVGLAALAAARPTGWGLAVLLGVIGVGIGSFTPANNRSLMVAAPPGTTGAVAGLLNMTRGLGTAAGTAVTVLVFTSAAGLAPAMLALVGIGVLGLLAE
ncbi:MAG TPA: MFS transporter [Mycobacteriales bacterium]|nr:MFS transporter [Mycobacteriales bacterium]